MHQARRSRLMYAPIELSTEFQMVVLNNKTHSTYRHLPEVCSTLRHGERGMAEDWVEEGGGGQYYRKFGAIFTENTERTFHRGEIEADERKGEGRGSALDQAAYRKAHIYKRRPGPPRMCEQKY